jgi:hypothetical protein
MQQQPRWAETVRCRARPGLKVGVRTYLLIVGSDRQPRPPPWRGYRCRQAQHNPWVAVPPPPLLAARGARKQQQQHAACPQQRIGSGCTNAVSKLGGLWYWRPLREGLANTVAFPTLRRGMRGPSPPLPTPAVAAAAATSKALLLPLERARLRPPPRPGSRCTRYQRERARGRGHPAS